MQEAGASGKKPPKPVMGWREWVALPALGLPRILAKIDTGARTSSLHAFDVDPFEEDGEQRVRFKVHPRERDDAETVQCVADVADRRFVTDSGGHREKRWVIETPVHLGPHAWTIEVTLADRTTMRHRMLLGRNAVKRRFVIDPGRRHVLDGEGKKGKAGKKTRKGTALAADEERPHLVSRSRETKERDV